MLTRPPIRTSELGVWIAEHMPQLGAELGPMPLGAVRERLNEITGLDVPPDASIADSIPVFLAALKSMKE